MMTSPMMNEAEPQPPSQEGGAKVAEPPAQAETKNRPRPAKVENLPLFKVLLHNDDINTMEHVVRSIVVLTPHDVRRAKEIMVEAHKTGLALVLVTHQEHAELYQEQFQSMS
ncbi:MAG: ATP-dependent Clp protease adaptor ClpS, partial [Phycisphaerales bacterium]